MGTAQIAIFLAVLSAAGAVEQIPSAGSTSASVDQTEFGTICVLPNSSNPPTRISPGGKYNPATLTVRIDKREPIPWPHKQSVKIESLTLNERHLVVLRSDGKRIQSFRFRFSDFKDIKLCLYFDGYQGVQLGDKHNALWCKCK
jgi:hypothetical protein